MGIIQNSAINLPNQIWSLGLSSPGVPGFGRTVNPISTRGADYAQQTILEPPDFQPFLRPWFVNHYQISQCYSIVDWQAINLFQYTVKN